jgi:hypothetical protein
MTSISSSMKTTNFQNSKVWGDGAPKSNATTIRYTNLEDLHVMTMVTTL